MCFSRHGPLQSIAIQQPGGNSEGSRPLVFEPEGSAGSAGGPAGGSAGGPSGGSAGVFEPEGSAGSAGGPAGGSAAGALLLAISCNVAENMENGKT